MAGPDKEPLFLTIIDSRIIHAFGPILRSAAQDSARFWNGGLFIYPHADGALCIATDGRAMMVMLDRKARIAVPRCFQLPDALIDACAPAKPLIAYYPGWQEAPEVPAWMRPARVHLTNSGAIVSPAMPHPSNVVDSSNAHALHSTCTADIRRTVGMDYWHGEPNIDVRRILSKAKDSAYGFDVNPKLVAMFAPAAEIFNALEMTWTPGGPGGAVVFMMDSAPDFLGLLMPLKVSKRPDWPAFAAELAGASFATGDNSRSEVAEGRP